MQLNTDVLFQASFARPIYDLNHGLKFQSGTDTSWTDTVPTSYSVLSVSIDQYRLPTLCQYRSVPIANTVSV